VGFLIAEDFDGAEAGAKQAGEDAQEGGLACAVFADEDVATAGFKIDGDLAEGGKRAEELGDVVEASAEWGQRTVTGTEVAAALACMDTVGCGGVFLWLRLR